jgi:predicted PurR-regulated permease PerM
LALVAGIGGAYQRFSEALPFYQKRIEELTGSAASFLARFGIDLADRPALKALDLSVVMVFVRDLLISLGGVLTNSFVILLAVIFLLLEAPALNVRLAANHESDRGLLDFSSLFQGINRYMGIKALISALTGVADALGLWLLGVDFPLIWGFLVFLLNFIPNIGSIIATIPPVLLAFVQLGPWSALATLGVFLTVDMILSNVLEPRLLGRGLGISSLVVLLSLVFWGWLLGPVGMLLSVPLTMAVKLALEARDQTRWVGLLLGGEDAAVKAERVVSVEGRGN